MELTERLCGVIKVAKKAVNEGAANPKFSERAEKMLPLRLRLGGLRSADRRPENLFELAG